MYKAFISYRKNSSVNAVFLRQCIVDESEYCIEDIFLDEHGIGPEFFDDKIKSAIASSNCVVLLVTKDCFKAKEQIEEDWFLEEIRTAISLGKKIIPVLFDKIESLSDSSIMVELNKNFNEYDIEIIVKSQSVPYSTDFPDASITKLVHFIEEANETRSVLDKTLFDLNARWHYISRDTHHQYAMGDEVERICSIEAHVSTERHFTPPKATYNPQIPIPELTKEIIKNGTLYGMVPQSILGRIVGAIYRRINKNKIDRFKTENVEVYSSIFAPAEIKRKSHLQVQVYLHLYEESEKVKSLAKESDKNAERRDYIPLSLKLKKGDKVDVEFNVYGETRLASEHKSIIWQGSFTKCSFDYFVPKDIDVEELSCEANLFVNGAMIGEMRFITQIVNVPRNLNPEILSHRFNRIFISYAHQDAQQIKLLALAYKAQGVDYFYDRESLGPGDVYKEKIFDYIDSSDLFVLCWSKNAATSDYVAIEKGRALLRAYPQLSQRDATLKICPISIEPRADLPSDMKGVYNFEVI